MADAAEAAPAVAVAGLSKRFGTTQALSEVGLTLRAGEVHGLLGHNGSGKSTLIKVLAGYERPDAGTVRVRGQEVPTPVPASVLRDHAIRFVHQTLGLVERLSVAENLWLDDVARGSRRQVSFGAQCRDARAALAEFGLSVDVRRPVAGLSAVEKANLAIVRAVCRRPGDDHEVPTLLVLDEPTAFLPEEDKRVLYGLVERVAARGSAVLFVSHFLEEVLTLCDRVTVLRDGQVTVAEQPTEGMTHEVLVEAIVGTAPGGAPPRPDACTAEVAAEVDGLSTDVLDDVSFTVRAGEIVGVTGLIGSGCDDVLGALFGVAPATGRVRVGGVPVDLRRHAPLRAMRAGIALVPADRNRHGVFRSLSITDNLAATTLRRHRGPLGLSRRGLRGAADTAVRRYAVRPAEPGRPVEQLSGGNAQKVLMAKWLGVAPRLLLLEEPTQGVDVGARRQIEDLVRAAARDGAAVLLSSGDPDQLAALCHRVLVFSGGRVTRSLDDAEVTKKNITRACLLATSSGSDEKPDEKEAS
ncbi:sugar ABC transporter ATP-binding protein [Pimelobacter sp. 30-1]|uniref:sugar ABC transporter ATP-binding protein n=1 Tax=Pimelobacter sp. 30-1 TaxID=2004991 RepID=UPI001C04F5DE|nr:sugar ABC transporter ATP-binding protein [Pimelobacter sp. 30-1]MBU2695953.1 hypothetical protein [Pimelobacter sp. 30-1]